MRRGVRRALGLGLLLLLLAVGVLAGGLALAHRAIDALDPPLPPLAELARSPADPDLPVALRWIDTARQPMPRAAVLDPARDPDPDAPYVMSHPAFVLEWADGRLLLVDVGMDPASARAFGRPLRWLAGAGPIEPLGSAASRLGPAAGRVRGIAFTHLHTDHVAGVAALCEAVSEPVPLFQTRLQAELGNFTTWPGRRQLEAASCLVPRVLDDVPPHEIPGFPGVVAVAAAGHTPGSTLFVVHRRTPEGVARYVLTGDVVNHVDGLRADVPKPPLYSLLVVPESTRRLGDLRRTLRTLWQEHGVQPLVSHDRLQLERSGVPGG
jgi:glyoxylase-like metal-dependent hydrolase (beta-lactamase superfamily II)